MMKDHERDGAPWSGAHSIEWAVTVAGYWGGFCLRVSVGFTPLKQTNEQRSGKDRTHKLVEMRTLWMILKPFIFIQILHTK